MTRPQIQEEAVTQVADLLQEKLRPDGLAIVMEADHYCMQWRGVKDMNRDGEQRDAGRRSLSTRACGANFSPC